ncbi:hypothetical protein [Kitasatospora sp. NBC_01266]|uniref:hypothetical protein n=1 Tax=Kitasatospora sp. NBC_01266 TaxID=2903572 RepID=UPI002E36EFEB|nr:hypothetical protein [Kitasatospora sp. NBC_01266]
MYDDRAYLAAFCRTLPQLRAAMHQSGRATELDGAVSALSAGTPVLEVLATLGIPVHVLTGAGVQRGGEPGDLIPGVARRASGESYRCPDQRCSLELVREPGGPIPAAGRCWLRDEPLLVCEA